MCGISPGSGPTSDRWPSWGWPERFCPGEGNPCYRCLYPGPPPEGAVPTCSQAGILGSVAGTLGTLQATEAVKVLLGVGESMAGRLLVYDALGGSFRTVRYARDPACPACGSLD